MDLDLKRETTQKQSATKYPELFQAIELHEKPELEIEQVIDEEIQSNIFLEENPVETGVEYEFWGKNRRGWGAYSPGQC